MLYKSKFTTGFLVTVSALFLIAGPDTLGSEELALGTVRVSMGRYTDEEQVRLLASCLIEVVNRHRALG